MTAARAGTVLTVTETGTGAGAVTMTETGVRALRADGAGEAGQELPRVLAARPGKSHLERVRLVADAEECRQRHQALFGFGRRELPLVETHEQFPAGTPGRRVALEEQQPPLRHRDVQAARLHVADHRPQRDDPDQYRERGLPRDRHRPNVGDGGDLHMLARRQERRRHLEHLPYALLFH
jgi:hypothetical protein